MAIDLAVQLIQATVQLEAPYGDGTRNVGTGFLVEAPGPDGRPRVVLVTAEHVLTRMPGETMTIGYRATNTDGTWKYTPQSVEIRKGTTPLWVTVAGHDVAAVEVTPTNNPGAEAVPEAWLADDAAFSSGGIGPGDEMMALGYPMGLSANVAGFPILRAGKVASYPIAPSKQFPTFLMDFQIFPGNSGGPVFLKQGQGDSAHLLITGVMTQQLETADQPLEIGVVTDADYIRQAIDALDKPDGLTHLARNVDSAAQAPKAFASQPQAYSASAASVSN